MNNFSIIKPILPLDLHELNKFRVNQVKRDNGCIEWIGDKYSGRYGRIYIKAAKTDYGTHRVAYYLHYGIDPGNKLVLHKCNNVCCVNPEHLYLGDLSDNQLQAYRDGRHNQDGERNPAVKVTKEQVIKIRKILATGLLSFKDIAEQEGVSIGCINNIKRGNTWKHLK